ncbi:unnamed protein product [Thelazia callipaeda]|uniref:Aa_trans domain-containing protein n=1 Tax=Thelazia callipaeda TaxID=103827 RepID=A0A0N5D1G1_THECL|nr:unnamed protein product [Thelazia callipaeda]
MINEPVKLKDLEAVQIKHGIGWIVAAVFIVADLVGGGVVAMPAAFGITLGIIFMFIICFFFTTTGWLLADTWIIMCKRFPEYRLHCRQPYPEMGLISIGKSAEIATKLLVHSTLIGTAIVYLLLSSKVFHNLLGNLEIQFSFCWLIIIVAVLILPITFLKSPADYWWAIVAAVACTVLAITLVFVGVSLDISVCYTQAYHTPASYDAVLSLGLFLFAFNGVALLYMPLSIFAFIIYGNSIKNSVIDSMQTTWIRYVADLAIALHCILTIIITVNPLNLQLEETFRIPHKFGIKRVVSRTFLMAFILFVGLTIPNFGSVMDLFGSTTIPCTCIILPSLFSLYICAATYDEKTNTWIRPTFIQILQRTPKLKLIYLIVVNAITIICAVISTIMAMKQILGTHFTAPCYVIPFISSFTELEQDVMNCCGRYFNISRVSDFTCNRKILNQT